MGNDIGKKYNIPKDHSASAGLGQLWKLYPVTPKEGLATDELTLWLIQKDDLSTRQVNPITDKTTLERVFQVMRKDIAASKDMDHNGLVKVIDVLEDNKKAFAFVTERILCSLADFLNQFKTIPGGFSFQQNYLEPNGTILESEIARGVLNLVEGLQYMHNVQKKLHLSVSPESIVMTPSGQWKLCSFGFALSFSSGDEAKVPSPYFMNSVGGPSQMRLEPDLRYCAPEMTEGGPNYQDVRYLTRMCDVFSLGLVAYEMFRYNLKLAPEGRLNIPPVEMYSNNVAQHYEAMHNALRSLDLSVIPPGLSQVLLSMVQDQPTSRMALLDIANSAYFHSGVLATLKSIDNICQRDMGTQASILSSLPGQLGGLPPRILECAVLPGLCKLTKEFPIMWNYSLPVHIFISARINGVAYQRAVSNAFIDGLADDSVETIQAFVRNMDHLRNSFDVNFFKCYVVPMICNALDKNISSLLVQSLQCLCDEKIYGVIDLTNFVGDIIPRVCKAACKNPEIGVKIKALYFMSLGCVRLDKKYLTDNYIPSLKYIVDNEKSAAVTMCILGVYDSIAPIVGYDVLAVGVLPLLCPMLSDRNLNKEQYRMVLERVVKFLDVVSQHRAEDLDLHAVRLQITDSGSASIENNMFGDARQISAPPPLPSLPAPSIPFSFPQDSSPGLPRSPPPSIPTLAPPPVPSGLYSTPPPVLAAPPVPAVPPVPLVVSAKIVRGANGLAPPVPISQPGLDAPKIPVVAPPPPPISSQTNLSSLGAMSGVSSSWLGNASTSGSTTYQPPSITPPSGQSSSFYGNTSHGSTVPPIINSSSSSASPDDVDVGDFLSSFKKPPSGTPSQQMPVVMGHGMSSMQQSFGVSSTAAPSAVMQAGAADLDMFLSGNKPGSTGTIRPPPSNGMPTNQYQSSRTSSGTMASSQQSPASGFAFISNPQSSSTSLEDQIRRTQDEINKLSAGVTTASPGGHGLLGIPPSNSASNTYGIQQGGNIPRASFPAQVTQAHGTMYAQTSSSFAQAPIQNYGQSQYGQTQYSQSPYGQSSFSQPNLSGSSTPYGSAPMTSMSGQTQQPMGGGAAMVFPGQHFPQQSYQGYGTAPGASSMNTHQGNFSNTPRGPPSSSTGPGYRPPVIPPPRGSGTQSNPNDPFGIFK